MKVKFGEANLLNGNEAAAAAVVLSRPKVIAVYPITPQTACVEELCNFKANGALDAEIIHAESEHSAISACIGAACMGVRTFTATSSQGLALMHEILFIASGMRLPIVMGVANRALSAPINIWNDLSDSMAQSHSGWIQLYCASNQEIFDTIIQAYKISEHRDVLLPSMVCYDGFVLSHLYEKLDLLTQEDVNSYLPELKLPFAVELGKRMVLGPLVGPEFYMEFKKSQRDAMQRAKLVIGKANKEFFERFGRSYGDGLLESYNLEGSNRAIITIGSLAFNFRYYVKREGMKVGVIRIRSFRPFPSEELREALEGVEKVAVVDRAYEFGLGGALYHEVRSCLFGLEKKVNNFILGLGGKKVRMEDLKFIIKHCGESKNYWVNVHGENVSEDG